MVHSSCHLDLAGGGRRVGHQRFRAVEAKHEELIEGETLPQQHRKARYDVGQARGFRDEPGHRRQDG